ncbi:MAG: HEAT repeat domain-containing protein [Zavarzinella sp.]
MLLRTTFLAVCITVAPAWAQPANPVKQAIDKGAEYLADVYKEEFPGSHALGKSCLAGMALLESGRKADDPVVENIANFVRSKALSNNSTYEVSLVIMFLDRLGVKTDLGLIQFMTLRLLSGQNGDGTWSYSCGLPLRGNEEAMLSAQLVNITRLKTPPTPKQPEKPQPKDRTDIDLPKTPGKATPIKPPAKVADPTPTVPGLIKGLEGFARLVNQGRKGGGFGDHSNTQFATVGCWCGRRHGVDVTVAMELLDKHYRSCQSDDGGWNYSSVLGSGGRSTPAMTCAGLIALAMAHGNREAKMKARPLAPKPIAEPVEKEPAKEEINDVALDAGLKCLGKFLADEQGDGQKKRKQLATNMYFMWSLERTGMMYGLQTIGKIDWYLWGLDTILDTQSPNGSWEMGGYHGAEPIINTSFAILFLSRANLAEDLTASLKGKVRDPGIARLVGGDISKFTPGTKPMDNNVVAPKEPTPMPMVPGSGNPPKTTPGTTPPVVPVVPASEFETKVAALQKQFDASSDDDKQEVLKLLETSRGGEHTEALARLARGNSGDLQQQIRHALAKRLTRMNRATLREMLRDRDEEVRSAAALATAGKMESSLVPDLIRLLADTEPYVVQAGRTALRTLAKVDHGPPENPSPAEKTKAVLAWQQWWQANNR